MDPNVFMCYVIYSGYNTTFKRLVYKWNKESKTYSDDIDFRKLKEDMRDFRKKYSGYVHHGVRMHWGHTDVRHLMNFIKEHLNW